MYFCVCCVLCSLTSPRRATTQLLLGDTDPPGPVRQRVPGDPKALMWRRRGFVGHHAQDDSDPGLGSYRLRWRWHGVERVVWLVPGLASDLGEEDELREQRQGGEDIFCGICRQARLANGGGRTRWGIPCLCPPWTSWGRGRRRGSCWGRRSSERTTTAWGARPSSDSLWALPSWLLPNSPPREQSMRPQRSTAVKIHRHSQAGVRRSQSGERGQWRNRWEHRLYADDKQVLWKANCDSGATHPWLITSLVYAVFLCDHTTSCEVYFFLRQMNMGSLTYAPIWVRAIHTNGGQAQMSAQDWTWRNRKTAPLASPCPTRESNPGSWDLNSEALSLTTELRPRLGANH